MYGITHCSGKKETALRALEGSNQRMSKLEHALTKERDNVREVALLLEQDQSKYTTLQLEQRSLTNQVIVLRHKITEQYAKILKLTERKDHLETLEAEKKELESALTEAQSKEKEHAQEVAATEHIYAVQQDSYHNSTAEDYQKQVQNTNMLPTCTHKHILKQFLTRETSIAYNDLETDNDEDNVIELNWAYCIKLQDENGQITASKWVELMIFVDKLHLSQKFVQASRVEMDNQNVDCYLDEYKN
ncbi:hypothetical protein RFI_24629 [Reticulomyxa filosa]|uniref:Uncharacterized protein n=1 Tax=Reticulomyxa filosa TaxID=46433 RepID=X6MH38_RETFI|nr:hypothetical protein RFI_24629 [Reticulomyxa filosa]|eukprot:ETO12747.1 hypothetical protein RFI_24629 [Reticulomyxa filosa]